MQTQVLVAEILQSPAGVLQQAQQRVQLCGVMCHMHVRHLAWIDLLELSPDHLQQALVFSIATSIQGVQNLTPHTAACEVKAGLTDRQLAPS